MDLIENISLDTPALLKSIPVVRAVSLSLGDYFLPLNSIGYGIAEFFNFEESILGVFYLYIILCSLLSLFYRLIPREYFNTKHFFNLVLGLYFCFSVHGLDTFNLLILTTLGFLHLKFFQLFRSNDFMSVVNGILALLIGIAYVTLIQAHVFTNDLGNNHKCIMIVLVQYHVIRVIHIPLKLYDLGIKRNITFLEYYGFNFHFPVLSSGPHIQIDRYFRYIYETPMYTDMKVILKKVFGFFGSAIVFISLKNILGVPMYRIEYENLPFLIVLKNMILGMYMCRYILYSMMYSGEMMCAIVGYGVTSTSSDGKPVEWKDIGGVRWYDLEFALSPRAMMRSWNRSVGNGARWLLYDRLEGFNPALRIISTMVFIGANHGLYPGYCLMWLSVGFLHLVYIDIYRKFVKGRSARGKELGFFTWMILWSICHFFVNYFTSSFVMVKWGDFVGLYSRFYFVPQILVLVAFLVLKLVPSRKKKVSVD